MNKKELYDKKIEIIKKFLENNGSIPTLIKEQKNNSEIIIQQDKKDIPESKTKTK